MKEWFKEIPIRYIVLAVIVAIVDFSLLILAIVLFNFSNVGAVHVMFSLFIGSVMAKLFMPMYNIGKRIMDKIF